MSVALDAPAPVGFAEKIWRINWGLVLVLTAIAGVGVVALYSAAGGRFDPWASRHAVRYGAAFALIYAVAGVAHTNSSTFARISSGVVKKSPRSSGLFTLSAEIPNSRNLRL